MIDETGFDPSLPIFGFIFLVALGVDYNIFLMDRVREEAAHIGTRRGALRALVATGPVITSAGIILAGTFAVLAMIPVTILVELGFAGRVRHPRRHVHRAQHARAGDHHRGRRQELVAVEAGQDGGHARRARRGEKEAGSGLEPALLAEMLDGALDAGGERRRAPSEFGSCARS